MKHFVNFIAAILTKQLT